MAGDDGDGAHETHTAPVTAQQQRARTGGANRTLAWVLLAVVVTFLLGAIGVGALVVYGPY